MKTTTPYKLMNVATGRTFEDEGWTLADPQSPEPSLVRAVYQNKKFTPRNDMKGLYRYCEWLPINHTLRHSHAPVTYKSKGLAKILDMENLYITFSGYCSKLGAGMSTCSFKETEAYSVCARLPKRDKRILVVQSAGNTARAFAKVCSDNNIPICICIPEDNKKDMWFLRRLKPCVKVVAAPSGSDYFDAIALGEKLAKDPKFLLEGGAKNVARRDGMGTTILSAVETIGRIPDAYFQAVGSGTGAIAVWENNLRLIEDGRFGTNKMKLFLSQNAPFTLMHDSWKADSRELVDITAETSRRQCEVILAKVLSNRKPPYSLAGGLYDAMKDAGGDFYTATNEDIIIWLLKVLALEGYDIFPASATAVASLAKAVKEGKVKKDDTIMLNITGCGLINSQREGYQFKKPDLVIDPDLDTAEIIRQVNELF